MLYLLASIDTTQDCDAVIRAAAMVRAGLLPHAQGVVSDATPVFDNIMRDDPNDTPVTLLSAGDVDTSASERDEPPPAVAEDAPAEPDAPAAGRKTRRKRADVTPEISSLELLDALHAVGGTGGFVLPPEHREANSAFLIKLLAGRRVGDIKGRERADIYAQAKAHPHQGVRE